MDDQKLKKANDLKAKIDKLEGIKEKWASSSVFYMPHTPEIEGKTALYPILEEEIDQAIENARKRLADDYERL